jgi:hypothetical protein
MKNLLLYSVLCFVLPLFSMENNYQELKQSNFTLMSGWRKKLADTLHEPPIAQQFTRDIAQLSLWELFKHEKKYIETQKKLDLINQKKIISLELKNRLLQTKQFCSKALPCVQAAIKAKIKPYIVYTGCMIGFCFVCCFLHLLLSYDNQDQYSKQNTPTFFDINNRMFNFMYTII